MMEESYTVEEEPQELPPVVSVETSEDGTTRRTETTVAKIDKMKNCRRCLKIKTTFNINPWILFSLFIFCFALKGEESS